MLVKNKFWFNFFYIFLLLSVFLSMEIYCMPKESVLSMQEKNEQDEDELDEDLEIIKNVLEKEQDGTPVAKMPLSDEKDSDKKDAENNEEEDRNIYLNFENTSLENFINYMAEIRKLNLIPDKGIKDAKISLNIREPVTKDGAWNIFLTVMEMAGFSIIDVNGICRILPKDKKITQPLPSYINVPFETLPNNDSTIRYVFFLNNLTVAAVQPILDSMLSEKHLLIPHDAVNGFIITDKAYNIRSAIQLVKELDKTGQVESVVVMKLKRTNAADVKALLEGLINKGQNETNPLARFLGRKQSGTTEYFPTGIRIISEDRTNSLILLGLSDSIKKIEDFIVNHIDTELKGAESPLHIYELQHTDASQIATILRDVTQAPEGGPGQQASKYGAIRGGVKYFKSMNFGVDKDGNRLIVSSTDNADWKMLKTTIKDLDKPQPQVAIETMFVSINVSNLKDLGGMIRSKKDGMLGKGVNFQSTPLTGKTSVKDGKSLLANLVEQIISTQGSTILTFGKTGDLWAIFRMLKEQKNVSILSQPFIMVGNKTKGTINIGEELQVLQEEGGGSKGYASVESKTSVNVTPQINLDGVIRMEIGIDISEFTNAAKGDKETKTLNTHVTMADGQILVLGGFVKTKVSEAKAKTPLLGDIPVLGWFFKRQNRSVAKNYIFIFMVPTIVKPRQNPGMGLYTKMKLHQATSGVQGGIATSKSIDPVFNWFFDPAKETYSHKVIDFANARYQPTTVDIKNDPFYRANMSVPKHLVSDYIPKEENTLEQDSFLKGESILIDHFGNSKNLVEEEFKIKQNEQLRIVEKDKVDVLNIPKVSDEQIVLKKENVRKDKTKKNKLIASAKEEFGHKNNVNDKMPVVVDEEEKAVKDNNKKVAQDLSEKKADRKKRKSRRGKRGREDVKKEEAERALQEILKTSVLEEQKVDYDYMKNRIVSDGEIEEKRNKLKRILGNTTFDIIENKKEKDDRALEDQSFLNDREEKRSLLKKIISDNVDTPIDQHNHGTKISDVKRNHLKSLLSRG
jgi:general secretion pathway protein D